MRTQDHEAIFRAFSHESLAVAGTAVGFTSTKYDPLGTGHEHARAKRVFLTAEDGTMRFTYDGTTPTSSVGHLLQSGDSLTLIGFNNIKNFQAIRTTATSGTIKASFER